jgi:DNA-binding CsgD family transcriptional regulator
VSIGQNRLELLVGREAECLALDTLAQNAQAGRSGVVVLRGEAGVGKSALLAYATERLQGWHVSSATGIESELELAYSGLHQICHPMLDRIDSLPGPQRDALQTVFGQTDHEAPSRFLVGLATLTLFAEVAEEQPFACIVDDAHWLDEASAQILAFVARRLLAERVVVIGATRIGVGDHVLAGLPELRVKGLTEGDARALLLANIHGPLDAAVCDQIIRECHGNPLALLELPRTWSQTALAGGFAVLESQPLTGRIEESYASRLGLLSPEARLLVLTAAAEPLGSPILLQRATEVLGIDMSAAAGAIDAGLIAIGTRVEFAHPLVRSAAYRSATAEDRRQAHQALGEVTDVESDPDRRAWHRSFATAGLDEDVALELENSADRAEARGGLAAAAAFLERAAALTPDRAKRAQRELKAANAKLLAGSPQAASTLLEAAVSTGLNERDRALAQLLEAQIAIDLRRVKECGPLLLEAARRLEPIDTTLARDTYTETLHAARIAGRLGGDIKQRAALAARNAPSADDPPRAADLFLDACAVRLDEGYVAGAPLLKLAVQAYRDEDGRVDQDVRWPGEARYAAFEIFDDESCHIFCARTVELARERGALVVLALALDYFAAILSFEGELDKARAIVAEADEITEAIDAPRYRLGRFPLAGLRGDEAALAALVAVTDPVAMARGEGAMLTKSEYAWALLYNGLGRYEEALPMAESVCSQDGETWTTLAMSEWIEAAARSGDGNTATAVLERFAERTSVAGTEWALGLEARTRALLARPTDAEPLYREAIERLGRCRAAPDHARAHLVYGEWLRRAGRRVDAREQLRTANEMFSNFGMEAFAERTRRELIATGENPRKRSADTRSDLTAQEAQIAQLAREGFSNPEIGAQLFLSPRTVEWHMRKVFAKLEITSRRQLDAALGGGPKPATIR